MIFFVITLSKVCNFANDNTWYSSNKEVEIVFTNLETDLNNVLAWKFMVLGTKDDSFVLNIGKSKTESSTEATILGVKSDN